MFNCKNDIYIDYFIQKIETGLYKVSNSGELLRKVSDIYVPLGYVTKYSNSNTPYIVLHCKHHSVLAHRVLFKYYFGYIDSSLTINHKDGNGLNNSKDNLELLDFSGQAKHKYNTLNYNPVIGNKKINKRLAELIRRDYSTGRYSYKDLCKKYSLCKSNISYIINNKIWV